MKDKLTAEDISPRVNELVAQYLVAKVKAEMLREQVDKVRAEVIQRVALYHHRTGERVTDIQCDWLGSDDEAFSEYLDEIDRVLRKKGLKSRHMDAELCPALVAEHERREVEWALIDEMSDIFEMGYEPGKMNSLLMCAPDGLKNRQAFIDAVVGAALMIEAKDFTQEEAW